MSNSLFPTRPWTDPLQELSVQSSEQSTPTSKLNTKVHRLESNILFKLIQASEVAAGRSAAPLLAEYTKAASFDEVQEDGKKSETSISEPPLQAKTVLNQRVEDAPALLQDQPQNALIARQSGLSEEKRAALAGVIQKLLKFFQPVAEFVGGAVYQWLHDNGEPARWLLLILVPGWNGLEQDVERGLPKSWAFEAGRLLGNGAAIVTGILEITGGGGAAGGGITLCATGAGCIAGAPAVAAGVALGLHGAGTTSAALADIARQLGVVVHSITNSPESGGTGGSEDIRPEDAQLEAESKRISSDLYANNLRAQRSRTIAVGRVIDSEGRQRKVVSSSYGEFTRDHRRLLEGQGYIVIPNSRGGNLHAEERMINWAESEIATGRLRRIEAIGVSHSGGICTYFCRPLLEERSIRPGSRWNDTWKPGSGHPRENEPPRQ